MDVTVADGKITNRKWQLIELRADRFGEDPEMRSLVSGLLAPYRSRTEPAIGATKVPLYRYAVVETTLDAILADALREAAGTQIALSNGFRFDFPIMPGPVRERDLWNAYPITARLRKGQVTGKQLRESWERELENVFASDPKKLWGGWLPRPSGLTFRFAAKAPKGKRITEIRVEGKPLRENALYTIATCEREGDRPDTLCRIPHARNVRSLEFDAHEAVRRYFARHSPITKIEGHRVVAEDLPPVVRSQFFVP